MPERNSRNQMVVFSRKKWPGPKEFKANFWSRNPKLGHQAMPNHAFHTFQNYWILMVNNANFQKKHCEWVYPICFWISARFKNLFTTPLSKYVLPRHTLCCYTLLNCEWLDYGDSSWCFQPGENYWLPEFITKYLLPPWLMHLCTYIYLW